MEWQIADATNRLSEIVNKALYEGPQRIRRRNEAVIVLAEEEYGAENATRALTPVPEEIRNLIEQLESCTDFLTSLIGCLDGDDSQLANDLRAAAVFRRDRIEEVLAPYPSIAGQRGPDLSEE